ncbi:hypothetical protein [Oceanobacter sp. 4_MG-2023]|uniref:DUF6127 family protein n=1 Tax=Oceanobacter sp. 4_MG-2023 TaxID=3062623 RepID=UPI002733D4D3|nr:hypothetical protein [Oceanobacter sp. 4_MG-2023]MDP2548899.1 hypothetical protein [Oceanobacter sp. 4_MG-2023]
MPDMNPAELTELVTNAAEQGTNNALARLGFDTNNHLETQADMAFVRQQRKASEQIGRVIRRSVIGLLVTGLISLLTVGIQQALTK